MTNINQNSFEQDDLKSVFETSDTDLLKKNQKQELKNTENSFQGGIYQNCEVQKPNNQSNINVWADLDSSSIKEEESEEEAAGVVYFESEDDDIPENDHFKPSLKPKKPVSSVSQEKRFSRHQWISKKDIPLYIGGFVLFVGILTLTFSGTIKKNISANITGVSTYELQRVSNISSGEIPRTENGDMKLPQTPEELSHLQSEIITSLQKQPTEQNLHNTENFITLTPEGVDSPNVLPPVQNTPPQNIALPQVPTELLQRNIQNQGQTQNPSQSGSVALPKNRDLPAADTGRAKSRDIRKPSLKSF